MDNLFFEVLHNETAAEAERVTNNNAIARRMFNGLFKEQQDVISDPAKYKSALCPRRAGKSWLVLTYAFIVALENPGANIPIITLTLKSGRNTYWKMVHSFLQTYGINAPSVHNSEMRITLDNNSTIFFIGAETRAEIDKLRGGAYDAAFVDECKSFAPAILHELLFEVVEAALSDRDGTMVIIGTPGSILNGPFFQATEPKFVNTDKARTCREFKNPHPYWDTAGHEPLWSFHNWSSRENIYAPMVWKRALRTKARNQWADDNPIWVREYLGRWAESEDSYVYAYANLFNQSLDDHGLSKVQWAPQFEEGYNKFGLEKRFQWRYLLGIDLGYEDDTAMVVVAYSPELNCMYQLYDFKSPHMIIDAVADKIDELVGMFGVFDAIVADVGPMKQLVESINQRYGLAIIAAEKQHKFDYIELVNSDFHRGRIKILPKGDLALEMQGLQFDTSKGALKQLAKTGKLREDPRAPNHLCDAFLYIWRYSYHFFGREKEHAPEPGTPEFYRKWYEQEIQLAVKERNRTTEPNMLGDLDDGMDPFDIFKENTWLTN